MLYQLRWQSHPEFEAILAGEPIDIEITNVDGITYTGQFETESGGALHIRNTELTPPGGQWSPLIAVPEPSVALGAMILFGVILLGRAWRGHGRRWIHIPEDS